jgi:hypothetical protein
MTTLGLLIGFVVLIGVGFYFIERSKERSKGKGHWQPDVDQSKAGTIKNLQTPPDR